MSKENGMPCVLGFDELFDDGIICGDTSYTMPMDAEEANKLMQEIIHSS